MTARTALTDRLDTPIVKLRMSLPATLTMGTVDDAPVEHAHPKIGREANP
jgi:hypothetical protein